MTADIDRTIRAGQIIRARLADDTLIEGTVAHRSKTGIEVSGDVNGISRGDEIIATVLLSDHTNRTFRARVNHVDTVNKLWHIEILEGPTRFDAPLV